jgi:hypothetical protein
VPEYLQLARAAQRHAAWQEYEAAHKDVFDLYYQEWGSPRYREAAIDAIDTVTPIVAEREPRVRALLTTVVADFVSIGLLADTDIAVVLLVGQHASNGWVTTFRGEPTLFLALEVIGEPPHDEVLIVHECVHLAHQLAGPAWVSALDLSIAGELYFEGLATAASRMLRPGHEDSVYYWFDDDHQSWADDCSRAAPEIFGRMQADIDETSFEVRRRYFAAPAVDPAVPARCGYWVGDRMCSDLLAQSALGDALHRDYGEIRRLAGIYLHSR